jgi:hypothetical protein
LSRKLSRNRIAGGEPRLGTASIYMASSLAFYAYLNKRNVPNYMATSASENAVEPAEILTLTPPQIKTSA